VGEALAELFQPAVFGGQVALEFGQPECEQRAVLESSRPFGRGCVSQSDFAVSQGLAETFEITGFQHRKRTRVHFMTRH
jgi:hypothetical protein